jgi:hypothetical protein
MWYYTTDRDKANRPDAAPDAIPDWAWDQGAEADKIAQHKGMTGGERDWIDWRAQGSPEHERPDVPQTIPDRWWDDNSYVLEKSQ